MNSLIPKLNKYLIDIIAQYNKFDLKYSIANFPKEYKHTIINLNEDLTIEDILVKSFQRGFKGFFISKSYSNIIKNIDSIINENVEKEDNDEEFMYYFIDDERKIELLDIFDLDNVIFRSNKNVPH